MFSHIRTRQQNPRSEVETFDITVFDEQGVVLAEIEGFAMRRIADPAKAMEQSSVRADARAAVDQVIEIAVPSRHLSAGWRRGADCEFSRAPRPRRSSPIPEPIAPTDSDLDAASPASRAARNQPLPLPHLPQPPAHGGIEATLTAWWQELLGVEQVGLDDDFFDLGGHSLIGVRLFAKIKKAYRADLELAVLFEARTVRQLSALIAQSTQQRPPRKSPGRRNPGPRWFPFSPTAPGFRSSASTPSAAM